MLPVFNMVDRRLELHLEALTDHPDWPVIPYASVFEAMTSSPPLSGPFPSHTQRARAIPTLWRGIERKLGS